jgi:RNA polymerase sigma factor (sigma-70 family)
MSKVSLTRDEIIKLIDLHKNNDKSAIQEIVDCNMGLIRKIASNYACLFKILPRDQFYDDLLQEGVIGVIEAAERFDSGKGTTFSTYAYKLIRGRIASHCMQTCGQMSLPFTTIKKAVQSHHGKAVVDNMRSSVRIFPGTELGICFEESMALEEKDELNWMENKVSQVVGNMSRRDREVMSMRLGLNGNQSMSPLEISRKTGVNYGLSKMIVSKELRRMKMLFKGCVQSWT